MISFHIFHPSTMLHATVQNLIALIKKSPATIFIGKVDIQSAIIKRFCSALELVAKQKLRVIRMVHIVNNVLILSESYDKYTSDIDAFIIQHLITIHQSPSDYI